MLTRRRFLGLAGGAAAAGTAAWAALLRDRASGGAAVSSSGSGPSDGSDGSDGRVLVVVQLSGGNDGLNTLVPLGDGRYHDLRPSLAVADAGVVALAGEPGFGLHPALAPLGPLWDAGRVAFVESIGFEGYSRSHFQALATWWTATPDLSQQSGWLGRWLDANPAAAGNPLTAISLGGGGSPALRAAHTMSTVISDLPGFTLRAPFGADPDALLEAFLATAAPLDGDPLFAAAQQSVTASVDAVRTLTSALGDSAEEAGAATAAGDTATPITDALAVAANLIDRDLGTRVLLVGGSGFDTHANQAGQHADLLADVAGGLTSFLATMDDRGLADKVLVVTTSEFGRRVAQNGSGGTDHGAASVQILAGGGGHVAGGRVVGDADLGSLADGDLRPAIDVRSLYAVALDWLGGPTDDLLGGAYDRFDLLAS